MDEFIWDVLHEEMVCDIALPRLPSRLVLEESGNLVPRESVLEKDFIQASGSLAGSI
jgi:pre-mRNA-splicing factor 38A